MSTQPTPSAPEYLDFPGSPTVVVRFRDYPFNELPALMDSAFSTLGQAMGEGKFTPTGPPFSRYERMPSDTVDCEVGFPVAQAFTDDGDLIGSDLPAGRLARAVHVGSYDNLGSAWETFVGAVEADGHTIGMPFWEAYHTEPTPESDPNTMETGLALLIDP